MSRSAITVIGNVGKVMDLRFAKNGRAVIKFSVASTDRVKDENGVWSDGDTTWFDVVSFGVLAEAVSDNVTKGKQVIVIGNLKRTEWEDKDGATRVSLEVLAENIGVVPFRHQNSGGRSDGRRTVQRDEIDAPF